MTSAPTPNLWCPFPVRANEHVRIEEVEDQLLDWALCAGLLADPAVRLRFTEAAFGECAAYVYPDAPDLLPYAKWLAWLFIADDEFDENRAPATGGIDQGVLPLLPLDLDTPTRPATAVTTALAELWRELAGPMPVPLRVRFRVHAEEYARSYATDAARARDGSAPDLGAYVALRRCSGAVETCVDLIERQPRARPANTSEQLRELRLAANDIVCWSNDVLSVGKEVRHGEMTNLVAVLHHATDMGWPAAVSAAAEMVNARTAEFDLLQQDLAWPGAPAQQIAFVEGLKSWIAGSLWWHRRSSRYHELPPMPVKSLV
ncbi:hypothetical protein JOF53_001063 [Crossiella equi]|uniref:Terpene synthase n=1 Tax=Crossiella equi TaxID=130796 RepID=A0ABS5A7A4_9PSEU|nr:hypothetical protein [Crossiella equi]MBP2472191.1 hypothetical protein [Crossiella equi]